MTTRSVRLDDIAYALGSVKLLSPEDFKTGKAERTVISLPGWLFDDGRPRKRTIDVGWTRSGRTSARPVDRSTAS